MKAMPAVLSLLLVVGVVACGGPVSGPRPVNEARTLWRWILSDLRRSYFDPSLRGLEESLGDAEAVTRLVEAGSLGSALERMDQNLEALEDSHTFIVPPTWTTYGDYGFAGKFIGDTAFVTAVAPGGAAARGGLQVGDEILFLGAQIPRRRGFWRVWYRHTLLNPRTGLSLGIRRDKEEVLELPLTPDEVVFRPFYHVPEGYEEWFSPWSPQTERIWIFRELAQGICLWRFDAFEAGELRRFREVFEGLGECRALILDLRDNVGGSVEVLEEVIAHFVEERTLIGSFLRRDRLEEFWVDPASEERFRGEVAVLVGSATGSAAEILGAFFQETGRGGVFGDRTAGAVMLSDTQPYQVRQGEGFWEFGLSISVGEYRTASGSLLEGNGLDPDELVLPTREQLRSAADPVASRALRELGIVVSPGEAAEIFRARTGEIR